MGLELGLSVQSNLERSMGTGSKPKDSVKEARTIEFNPERDEGSKMCSVRGEFEREFKKSL